MATQRRDVARERSSWLLPEFSLRGLLSCTLLVVACLSSHAFAGYRERGNMSLSVAASFAHTQTYDRRSDTSVNIIYDDDFNFREEPAPGESYSDIDSSVFLSAGYFVRDRLELGLSGSLLKTSYSGTDREAFSVYDVQFYTKYFFENDSSFTPYLKGKAGMSFIDTGDYEEANAIFGAVAGLEFLNFSPVSFFLELTSDYTELGGSLSGSEWRNQVYFGVSWYLDFSSRFKRRKHNRDMLSGLDPEALERVREADEKWGKTLERVDEEMGGDSE